MASLLFFKPGKPKTANDVAGHKKNLKKALPLTDNAKRRENDAAVSKQEVADRLVFLYANESNSETKETICSLLSKWLSNGELRAIPSALTGNMETNNPAYIELFFLLAPSAPRKFAEKTMELLSYSTINIEYSLRLSELLKQLVSTKKASINKRLFSQNLLITLSYLINAKELLLSKETRNEEEREKLRMVYVRSLIISDLLPFVRLSKKDLRFISHFLDMLVEVKYFKPAVNTVLNLRISEKEKTRLGLKLHSYFSFIKKHIPCVWDEVKSLDKTLLDFLEKRKIFPLD